LRSKNNRISSNTLTNSDTYGIELENTTENIIINNYIDLIGNYAIYLDGIYPT